MRDLIRFEWGVPETGLRWRDARPVIESKIQKESKSFLTAGFTTKWMGYNPLAEYPALFRTFAGLEVERPAIQAFATHYGFLGIGFPIAIPNGRTFEGGEGETLSQWRAEIVAMRHGVLVWDAVQEGRAEDLDRWFQIRKDETSLQITYQPDDEWPLNTLMATPWYSIGGTEKFLRFISHMMKGETANAVIPTSPQERAISWIRATINQRVHQQLDISYVETTPAPGTSPLAPALVPRSLCAALWLQFAESITGKRSYRRCDSCAEWYTVPAKALGKPNRYCSNRCRTRGHRDRKTRALRLCADGRTASQIAKEIETDIETVKRWVKAVADRRS